jgi:hypothetical protein
VLGGPRRHRLDLVGPARGLRQRRLARPPRDQRHDPRGEQFRHPQPHDAGGNRCGAHPRHEGLTRAERAASCLPQPPRRGLCGRLRRMGPRRVRCRLRRGHGRFRQRRRPRPGLPERRRRRECLPQ